MSDTPAADETPIFNIQKIYVKDLSFENPNAPEVFTMQDIQPNVEMNLSLENKQVDEQHWEVTLKISAIMRDQVTEKLLFEVEVEHAALFFMKNIPEDKLLIILGVDCPTILFPYTRQLISQVTVDGGFMPLLLEPINFSAAFEASKKKQTLN